MEVSRRYDFSSACDLPRKTWPAGSLGTGRLAAAASAFSAAVCSKRAARSPRISTSAWLCLSGMI